MKEVRIEGAPIQELYQALRRLEPLKVPEICYFAQDPQNPGCVDPRVAVIRRSHDWIPLELRQYKDGGYYIAVGVEGVELHLNEKYAMDFISYIREYRRNIDKLLESIAKDVEEMKRLGDEGVQG